MRFSIKQDSKGKKIYVSITARVLVGDKTQEKTVCSLGGFDVSEVKKTTLLLSSVLTGVSDFLEHDNSRMTRRTGNEIKNVGCIYVKVALNDLGLADFWKAEYNKSLSKYDYRDIFYFLIASTIVDPQSILGEVKHKGIFVDNLKFDKAPVYRFLDKIYDHCETMQTIMFQNFDKLFPKDGKIRRILYDGTNIYFEIKESDFDSEEEYEEAYDKALRTFGFSKENSYQYIKKISPLKPGQLF